MPKLLEAVSGGACPERSERATLGRDEGSLQS